MAIRAEIDWDKCEGNGVCARVAGEIFTVDAEGNSDVILEEIPPELLNRIAPAFSSAYQSTFTHDHYEFRTNPYARRGKPARFKEAEESYRYENEDQSSQELRSGMRVRHAQFGVGTVISVEEHNNDMKITVRFNLVGVKKLLAKYAKLEPA